MCGSQRLHRNRIPTSADLIVVHSVALTVDPAVAGQAARDQILAAALR